MIAQAVRAAPDVFGVWPENLPAFNVLMAMQTQLRRSGIDRHLDGLDYNVLPWVMRRCGVKEDETDAVFARLQCAEDELLAQCNR